MIENMLEGVQREIYEEEEKSLVCRAYISFEGKLMIVVSDESGEHVYEAYECDNVKEDTERILETIRPFFEEQVPTANRTGVHKSRKREISHPVKYGFVLVWERSDWFFMKHLFYDIKRTVESIREKIVIMNTENVLKNALKVWCDIQPSGFRSYHDEESYKLTDRYEKSNIDYSLSFLKKWDFLLLAQDQEIRELYMKYYEATVRLYNCQMNHDR